MSIEIKIECINDGRIPTKATEGSAGYDLYAAEDVDIPFKRSRLISTGLKLAIPQGYEGQIRSRSGLALKYGIIVLNSPGTIDSDYRGEVKVLLANFGMVPFKVKKGDRIAQLVFAKVPDVELVESDIDNALTERGTGGFGSTGR